MVGEAFITYLTNMTSI